MTQLILDTDGAAVALPESRKGGYTAELAPLSEDVEMISGRLVRELRGSVWKIGYRYGYFKEEMKDRVIAACRRGQRAPIRCAFLTQDGALREGRFFVTSFTYPKFYWSKAGKALWGDFELALREVKPSAQVQ